MKKNISSPFYISIILLIFIVSTSCKKSVKHCVNFDSTSYLVGDTIRVNASCSENVDQYFWAPEDGLIMLGSGALVQEDFVILPLSGTLTRTVSLKITNKKSEKTNWESVIVF
jgi:hypothetical protein